MDPTIKQKKIALAQSEHIPAMIEIMRDCTTKKPLIGKDQYETLINAVTLDVESSMLMKVVDYIERIKKGELHEEDK